MAILSQKQIDQFQNEKRAAWMRDKQAILDRKLTQEDLIFFKRSPADRGKIDFSKLDALLAREKEDETWLDEQ
jgi:hypothetical protein